MDRESMIAVLTVADEAVGELTDYSEYGDTDLAELVELVQSELPGLADIPGDGAIVTSQLSSPGQVEGHEENEMSTATATTSVSKADLEVLAARKGMGKDYVTSMIAAGLQFKQLHGVLAAMPNSGAAAKTESAAKTAPARPAVFASPAEEIAWYRAENERLKARNGSGGKLTLKVSEKGALSVYGMGRFPVTLYSQQWERLIAAVPAITAFIAANRSTLVVKD